MVNLGCAKESLLSVYGTRKDCYLLFCYLSTLFCQYDVKCQSFVHHYSELTVPASHPSPCNRRVMCNWLFDQHSLSVMDCDGCNSER